MKLWRLAGLEDAERIAATFPGRLAETAGSAWDALARRGSLHLDAPVPSPAMPEVFAEMLAAAIALEAAESPRSDRRDLLEKNYLEAMPSLWVEQLATSAAPNAALFHTRLQWMRMPRLSSLIDRLFALVAAACGDTRSLEAESAEEFRAARPTLATLYRRACYGGFMPLLHAYPADLAAMGRALDAGATVEEVIDRMLSAPLAHELAHLGRARRALQPLYLDECITAHVGALIRPETLWPEPGDRHALFGAPWLAQVGQALARTVGEGPLLAGHSGTLPWRDVLPTGLEEALGRLGWQEHVATRTIHFLSSTHSPDPWMKLFFLAAAGVPVGEYTLAGLAALPWREVPAGAESPLDRGIVDRALRAVCLRNSQSDGAFRVERRAPVGPITVDVESCRVSAAPAESGFDLGRLAYLFPPAVAARLRARGIAGFTVVLDDFAALAHLTEAILDGAASHRAPGYTFARLTA